MRCGLLSNFYCSNLKPQNAFSRPEKHTRSLEKANKLELIVERHLITQSSPDTCLFTCVSNCFISNIRALPLSNITSFTSHQRFTCCGNYFWWMINSAMLRGSWTRSFYDPKIKNLMADNANFSSGLHSKVLLRSFQMFPYAWCWSEFRWFIRDRCSDFSPNLWLSLFEIVRCNYTAMPCVTQTCVGAEREGT